MSSCKHFQAVIDRFEQATPLQIKSLGQHLDGCQSCRDYKAQADSCSKLLKKLASTSSISFKAKQQHENIVNKANELRYQTIIAILGFAISIFALLWFLLSGELTLKGGAILAGWGIVSGLYAWYMAAKSNLFHQQQLKPSSELFASWRNDLKFKIAVIKYFGSLVLLSIVSSWLFVVDYTAELYEGVFIFYIMSLILVIFLSYQVLVVLPSLRNELALLAEDER